MSQKVAHFEKVSLSQFRNAWEKTFGVLDVTLITCIYQDIMLPKRATVSSAGYDFFLPIDVELKVGEEITIPTGIRVKMANDYCLQIYPRSSLGYKYRLQLNNTVGIIDSDYYYAENEGHIFARLTYVGNNSQAILSLEKNHAFMQGVFIQYGITDDDDTTTIRHGGMGSTDK